MKVEILALGAFLGTHLLGQIKFHSAIHTSFCTLFLPLDFFSQSEKLHSTKNGYENIIDNMSTIVFQIVLLLLRSQENTMPHTVALMLCIIHVS